MNIFFIVLQGVSDAKYEFTFVDAGAYGKQNDGEKCILSTFSTFMNDEK